MKAWVLLLGLLAPLALAQSALELEVLQRTNTLRAQSGLPPLAWEPLAYQSASQHARDMLERGYFAHQTPEGLSSADRMHRAGILEVVTGENLASFQGYPEAEVPARALSGWMNSPGHRANLLNPSFTHLGVALVRKGDKVMVVQNFVARPFDPQVSRTPAIAERETVALVGSAPSKLGVFVGGGLYATLEGRINTRLELPPGTTPDYGLFDGQTWWGVQPGERGVQLSSRIEKSRVPGTQVRFTLPAGSYTLSVGAQPQFWQNLSGPATLELTLPNTLDVLWIGVRQKDQVRFTHRIPLGP